MDYNVDKRDCGGVEEVACSSGIFVTSPMAQHRLQAGLGTGLAGPCKKVLLVSGNTQSTTTIPSSVCATEFLSNASEQSDELNVGAAFERRARGTVKLDLVLFIRCIPPSPPPICVILCSFYFSMSASQIGAAEHRPTAVDMYSAYALRMLKP